MGGFLSRYPYMAAMLAGFVLYALIFLFFRSQRRVMFFASIVAMPQAFTALLLVPHYWNPECVAIFLVCPEDLMFCFLWGGFAWVVGVWIVRNRLRTHPTAAVIFRRGLIAILYGIVMWLALQGLGVSGILVPILIQLTWAFLLLLIRPNIWPIALTAALCGPLFHALCFLAIQFAWPHFVSYWNGKNLWGIYLGTIPLEELIWSMLYPVFWSLNIAYILDSRIVKSSLPD